MQEKVVQARKRSFLWGVIGGVLLLSIYFFIVSVANSFGHAVNEFGKLWYWIAALTVGFGIQVGLFTHVRQTVKIKQQLSGATTAVATGAGVSTVSMIACCAHHLSDLLPVLGLSVAAAFLVQYQLVFILAGVISNILGITYMLSIIARHKLYFEANRWLTWFAGLNYRRIFVVEAPLFFAVLLVGILSLNSGATAAMSAVKQQQPLILEQREVAGNGVWVVVDGKYDPNQQRLDFNVRLTTHSGSLDFEVDKIAKLAINGKPQAISALWNGSAPGGHHRSGRLSFKDVPGGIEKVVLELSAADRLGLRRFEWKVK
jgi:hypothetical protein